MVSVSVCQEIGGRLGETPCRRTEAAYKEPLTRRTEPARANPACAGTGFLNRRLKSNGDVRAMVAGVIPIFMPIAGVMPIARTILMGIMTIIAGRAVMPVVLSDASSQRKQGGGKRGGGQEGLHA